jgi:hypothetical protein
MYFYSELEFINYGYIDSVHKKKLIPVEGYATYKIGGNG